jgi:hypothetical protein
MDKCRSLTDACITICRRIEAERIPGFHRIMVSGNYLREAEYALNMMGVGFDDLR